MFENIIEWMLDYAIGWILTYTLYFFIALFTIYLSMIGLGSAITLYKFFKNPADDIEMIISPADLGGSIIVFMFYIFMTIFLIANL